APAPEVYLNRFPSLDREWLTRALAALAGNNPPATQGPVGTDTASDAASASPAAAALPVALPARFDDYELLAEIARRGMGVVDKARQVSLNRVVALKMILHNGPTSAEAVGRFHREAQAAAALDHPNIVAIHASGQQDGRPFFTMAYVEGDNLRIVVQRQGL